MPKRFLGNIMTDAPTAPDGPYQDGAASGVWSLAEALSYTKGGLWPITGNGAPTGLLAGGFTNAITNAIVTFNISVVGSSTSDFGDLSSATKQWSMSGNYTRAVLPVIGSDDSFSNQINYVQYSTLGNSIDFGDLTLSRAQLGTVANSTRILFAAGYIPNPYASNVIDYVSIASTGNALDFGDLTVIRNSATASVESSSRGIFAGGYSPSSSGNINTMDYVTILSTGNATDFGDLATADGQNTGVSSGTRGVFTAGTNNREMHYVTISSTGNTTSFGDLSSIGDYLSSSCSNTRGVFYGGSPGGAVTNAMEYITVASAGNGTDFGDLTTAIKELAGTSRVHGGLAA
tara:strand:- start:8 stop:1045 length:1038 start_codon:yes stop_codon:yes gene_type:complete